MKWLKWCSPTRVPFPHNKRSVWPVGRPVLRVFCLYSLLACVAVGTASCTYAERKWNQKVAEFNKGIDQQMAQSEGKASRCQARGGVLYNEQCYMPDMNPAVRDEQTCRLHGGLFINEECLTDQRRNVSFQ